MTNGAKLIGDTLKVSMIVDFQTTVGPMYKLACVITEDSVTGSGPDYYQANAYSGGTSLIDVDGSDWNQKPGNVPDYMMTYKHVARYISPSFSGNPIGKTYNTGEKDTVCFEFILDPNWDKNQISPTKIIILKTINQQRINHHYFFRPVLTLKLGLNNLAIIFFNINPH